MLESSASAAPAEPAPSPAPSPAPCSGGGGGGVGEGGAALVLESVVVVRHDMLPIALRWGSGTPRRSAAHDSRLPVRQSLV